MKAKHFKRLRHECEYYEVDIPLEGSLLGPTEGIIVLARSHKEACFRACKRGFGTKVNCSNLKVSTLSNGKYRVKLVDSGAHWANSIYYK
jgi:hypothetical protein